MFINHYYCIECNYAWECVWECVCNDHCPKCDKEIEPELSEDVTPQKAKKNG